MFDTLPNECSRPIKDKGYGTNLNILISRPMTSYSKITNGVVKIFDGTYWKISMNKQDSDVDLSASETDSIDSSLMDFLPKFVHERRLTQQVLKGYAKYELKLSSVIDNY